MAPFQQFPITRRQFEAVVAKLNRTRLAKPDTGSFLENFSKLLQVIAIFVGGAWVLIDYFEFKKTNNELTNAQAKLAIQTAELTQGLSKLKFASAMEGRLAVETNSTVVRSARFPDGSYLYRYTAKLALKNVSETTVVIPGVAIEFFVGTLLSGSFEDGQAVLMNLPTSFRERQISQGAVKWTKLQAFLDIRTFEDFEEGELKESLKHISPMSGTVSGDVRSGTSSGFGLDFIFRSRPENVAGSVITIWHRAQSGGERDERYFANVELLAEAEDAPSLKSLALKPELEAKPTSPQPK